jgi:hypothetical protein
MMDGYRPIWACGSTSELKKFPLIPGIGCLTIFADHDELKDGETIGAGDEAANETAERWCSGGREVYLIRRDEIGDYNDAIRGRS